MGTQTVSGNPRVLLVVSPHPDDFDSPNIEQNLIDESMLDVDSPRAGSCEISAQFLEGGRILKGIPRKDIQERLCFWPQS